MLNKILIVGCGLYGAVCGRLLSNARCEVVMIDKSPHIGGACYDYDYNGVTIQKYGIHVFHTFNKEVWDFVNKYSAFRPYELKVIGKDENNDIYSLPFNMYTFQKLFKTDRPEDAFKKIEEEKNKTHGGGFSGKARQLVGDTIYEKLIKVYTEKQWGDSADNLPVSIIKRLPVRFSYDNRYFSDYWQGLPINGYTELISNIINGRNGEKPIEYHLGKDFLKDKDYYCKSYDIIIYCGSVDELLDYSFGELEWRSLMFKDETYLYNGHNGQGCPLLNDFSTKHQYTRSIDHIFLNATQPNVETIVTYEYPQKWKRGLERYYPIENDRNNILYERYCSLLSEKHPNIHLGGRIGLFRYMNMDDTIFSAMNYCKTLTKICI